MIATETESETALSYNLSAELLRQLSAFREQGRSEDCLEVINYSYTSGQQLRDPTLSPKIQKEADNPMIWVRDYQLLKQGIELDDRENMPRYIRNAFILGMDKDPQAASDLYRLVREFGIQFYQPSMPEMIEATSRTLNLGGQSHGELASKLHYFLINHLTQVTTLNQERGTAQTPAQLTEVYLDTLKRWKDAVVPRDETADQSIRVSRILNRYFFEGKITGEQSRKISYTLVNLFQDPYIQARYFDLARFLEDCKRGSFHSDRQINGQMLAFLYSIKIITDEKTTNSHPNPKPYPDLVFGQPLSFIKRPRPHEGRDKLLRAAAKTAAVAIPMAATIGSVSVGARVADHLYTRVMEEGVKKGHQLSKSLSQDFNEAELSEFFSEMKQKFGIGTTGTRTPEVKVATQAEKPENLQNQPIEKSTANEESEQVEKEDT